MSTIGSVAAEEQNSLRESDVRVASFDRAGSASGERSVQFAKRPPHVGDRVEQSLHLEMKMTTTIRQGAEWSQKDRTQVRNSQKRVVTTMRVADGCPTGVRVVYLTASKRVSVADGEEAARAAEEAAWTAQPIQGKTYLCERAVGEKGELIITYEDGAAPPSEECEIVAEHMEMVGRPNPLADFLAGRTVRVGETLVLPREVANKIFSLGDQFGSVESFKLTLQKVNSETGVRQAVFLARVEAASSNTSQMRMQVEGELAVEVDTCRALKVDLGGPIAMSETRGSYSTAYQVIGTGHLQSRISSMHRDARR